MYFWALCSVPMVYMAVLMRVPYYFDYCSFVTCLEIRKYEASIFALISQDYVAILGPLWFHTNFRTIFYIFAIGILIGLALNMQKALDSVDILIILSSNP